MTNMRSVLVASLSEEREQGDGMGSADRLWDQCDWTLIWSSLSPIGVCMCGSETSFPGSLQRTAPLIEQVGEEPPGLLFDLGVQLGPVLQ